MPYANPPVPRCHAGAAAGHRRLCILTGPPPATSVDDACAITEQRLTPERDQINNLGQLTEQGYTGNTSRLSGHFEMAAADGRYAVHDTYLLGDRDTSQIAKQHLMERLKRQALDQAGVYRAFEERLSADQQLEATSVLVSGSIVALHGAKETVRPIGGDRLEMTLTATAIVDSSGLQRHLDALYDNHALTAANVYLQRENRRLREHAPIRVTPDGNGQHQATPPAARAETPTEPADMPFSAITFATDLASWLKNDDLAPWLRLEGYDSRQADWIKAFQEQPSDGHSRSRLTYQPEGVDATPQTYADVRPLKRQLAQDVSRLTRDYNAALDVDIVKTAPSPHTQGTEYTVHVTGFDGFVKAVLEATGLPFTHGQLTPEQIQALDPWRSLKYWLAADLFAPSPLVLSLSVNAD